MIERRCPCIVFSMNPVIALQRSLKFAKRAIARPKRLIRLMALLLFMGGESVLAHPPEETVTSAATQFLNGLSDEARRITLHDYGDLERFAFRWTPGQRSGVPLAKLSAQQNAALKTLLHHVLSHAGQNRVDAILATEAALGVIERRPGFRDPNLYYTAIFGAPEPGRRWGLRFEGHHLSVNLTFDGDTMISASPLFLGAHPETIPDGPDKGLRAVGQQVDLARSALAALTPAQRKLATGSSEWFAGFLTSPGSRRASLGRPAGIAVSEASPQAQKHLRALIDDYVRTIAEHYAERYLEWLAREEWPTLRFYWKGGAEPGASYYWRLQGKRFLLEHDGLEGGRHIHSIWRDTREDFGG